MLPNGPEMATAFLSVASAGVSAPLNPAYVDDEFEFYLSDLQAKALIVEAGSDSPAVEVARKLGVPIVELVTDEAGPAGTFTLRGPDGKDVVPAADATPDLAAAGRRRPDPPHLGHDLPPEAGAAPAAEPGGVGPPHRPDARPDAPPTAA